MKLWTHHPEAFRIDDPKLKIDPTRGQYWNSTDPYMRRYRELLRWLQRHFKTDQFLWCVTTPEKRFIRTHESIDQVDWELDVPFGKVLSFYDSPLWHRLLEHDDGDWERLVVDGLSETEAASPEYGALVRVPIVGNVKRLGKSRPQPVVCGKPNFVYD